MSRNNRSSNSGAIPAVNKQQPALVSYAQTAKQIKASNSKAEALPSSNNDRSKENKNKTQVSETKSNNDTIDEILASANLRLPEPERKIENKKVIFGFFDDIKAESFPKLEFYENKQVDFAKITFGSGLEKLSVSDKLIITAPILPNKSKLIEKDPKVNDPTHGVYSKNPAIINNEQQSQSNPNTFTHNQPFTSGAPHPNSMPPNFNKSPFVPATNHPYPQGPYPQFSPQGPGQLQWGVKPTYQNNIPGGSPNSQSSYSSGQRSGKGGIHSSPGGFQQNSSPGNPGPNGPGGNWSSPYYHGYPTPHFDPNYPHFPGFIQPYPVMPPHNNMVPPNQGVTPHLNTNALPFVPGNKTSKAIKIINPLTKAQVVAPANANKEATPITTPTTPTPPVIVRISKPVPKEPLSSETPVVKNETSDKVQEKTKELTDVSKSDSTKQEKKPEVKEVKTSDKVETKKKVEAEIKEIPKDKEPEKVAVHQNIKKEASVSINGDINKNVDTKVETPIKNVSDDKLKGENVAPIKNTNEVELKDKSSTAKDSVKNMPETNDKVKAQPNDSNNENSSKEILEPKPIESKPIESKPIESKPIESKPIESKPIESKPAETEPKIEEPTIISAKTETVVLTKAKPKRAVRAGTKPAVASTEPTKPETVAQQTEVVKEPESKETASKEVSVESKETAAVPQEAEKPAGEINTGTKSSAPPGFGSKPPGFNGVVRNDSDSSRLNKTGLSIETKGKPPLQRLGSLNLGSAGLYSPNIASPSPRTTEFFEQVSYPPNINRPNLPDGMFRYDRSFLLQFKEMCIDKPQEMKNLDAIANDDQMRQDSNDRRGMHRRMNSSRGSSKNDSGDFSKPRNSEERFKLSNMQMRGDQSGRGQMGGRTSSGGHLPGLSSQLGGHKESRNRSNRGGRGGKHNNSQGGPTIPLDQVVPLEKSENRWIPKKKDDDDKEAQVTRKTKSLLNKLTLEKFDSISSQIIELANESVKEKDGFTLKTVIQLIFEKACDEPNFSAMYAKLCQRMQVELNSDIIDEEVRSKDNEYTRGGNLFRKYILTRCQKEFEKGWKVEGMQELQESDMMSDEYYKLAKAKRQGLGLIRFIGEVFKLNMLTEKIMHYCIRRLLDDDPDDEEVESLSKLFSTIGKQLDTIKNKPFVNKYFEQIQELSKSKKLSQRIRFMLLDLIDLRKNKWQTGKSDTPKTLQQIKDDAARESEEKNKQDKVRRQHSSGGRGLPPLNSPNKPSFDKDNKRSDGWNSVSGNSLPSSRTKIGDLSGFGNLSKTKTASSTLSFGPSSVFNSLGSSKPVGREPTTQQKRPNITNSNIFDMLADNEPKASPTRPSVNLLRKPSSAETTEEQTSKSMEPELIERKAKTLVDEYLNSKDIKEALLTAKEFDGYNCYDEVINKMIAYAIEKKKPEVESVAGLLEVLNKEGVVTKEDFIAGAKKFMPLLEDLCSDVPFAFTYMSLFLTTYSISLAQLIELAEPLSEYPSPFPPGPKFFVAYIEERLKKSDEATLIKEFEDNCDITMLYNPKDREVAKLEKLCDDSKIKFLVPSIKESSAWKGLH
ncbi:hypothetical protein K502DRAFT_363640 [Neoconidiobolus thromboides FSU 785]|nr:hypothetical protein K502DRAFT_363640 [Neoconidiobolus thromboides FSU 785]